MSLAYYNRGLLYHQQSNFELALADFNKAISLDPKYLEAYTNRANLYYQQGNFELALVDFNRAIEIDPNFAIAYRNLGVLHKDLKNIEAARTNLEKAQQLFIAQNNVPAATEIDNLLKQLPR